MKEGKNNPISCSRTNITVILRFVSYCRKSMLLLYQCECTCKCFLNFFFLLCKWFSFHSPLSDFWFLFLLIQIIFVFTNYYNLHVFCLSWFRFVCAVFTSYLKKQSVSVVADCLYMFFSLTIMWLGRCSFAYWLAFSILCAQLFWSGYIGARKKMNQFAVPWLVAPDVFCQTVVCHFTKCAQMRSFNHVETFTKTVYYTHNIREWANEWVIVCDQSNIRNYVKTTLFLRQSTDSKICQS